MSKSKKRMFRRLTIVTVVVAIGVFAIFQSQQMAKETRDDNSDHPMKAADDDEQQSMKPEEKPNESTVVRGNNDQEVDEPASRGGGFIPPPAPSTYSSTDESAVGTGTGNAAPDFAPPPAAPSVLRSADALEPNYADDSGGEYSLPPALETSSPREPLDTRQTDTAEHYQAPDAFQAPTPARAHTPLALPAAPVRDDNSHESLDNNYSPAKSSDQFDNPTNGYDAPGVDAQRNSLGNSADGNSNYADSYGADTYAPDVSNSQASASSYASAGDKDAAARASSSPGPKHLEGIQTPSIALQKQAPPEIQVGTPATFLVRVQNVGQATAEEVTVFDRVPRGTRFLDASPQAERLTDDSLIWRLGKMKPGEEKTISIELQPQEEGEIGSVARVTFESQASVRTVCTRPQLELQVTAPPKVLIGQTVSVGIRISNPGTGAAEGVILEEDVPENFSHPSGGELEFEVGTLRPGESRTATLTLRAEKAGVVNNVVEVRGAGNLAKDEKVMIEVIAPDLNVEISGPSKRFLERRANYSVALANPGTASARNVEMVAFLHKGMKFIEANNQGQYDPQNHAVYWSLEELPAGERGNVSLSVLPIETGNQRLRVESRADLGIQKADDHEVSVDGLASLFFDVVDTADPIEVGSDTVYRVRVINQGSKAATNVRIFAALPGGMKPIGADGPSGHQINGQSVLFDAIARLEPKAEAMFKIQSRGTQAGRHQIRIQMVSDSSAAVGQAAPVPVSKEESTLVYSDR